MNKNEKDVIKFAIIGLAFTLAVPTLIGGAGALAGMSIGNRLMTAWDEIW